MLHRGVSGTEQNPQPPSIAPRRLLSHTVLLATHPIRSPRLLRLHVVVNPQVEGSCVVRIFGGWANRLSETSIIPNRRITVPFLGAALIEVGFEDVRIQTVRLEADIQDVADDRHQADEEVERDIAQHSELDARWKTDL